MTWIVPFLIAGCATSPSKPIVSDTPEMPVKFQFAPREGEFYKTKLSYINETLFLKNHVLDKSFIQSADILLETKLIGSDNEEWVLERRTLEKDGLVNLHHLGLPELYERIRFVFDRQGRVLDAEGFSQQSVFTLPDVVFPEHEIRAGDSWRESYVFRYPELIDSLIESQFVWTLEGFLKEGGRDLALIRFKVSSRPLEAAHNISFSSRGKGKIVWDRKRSRIVSSESFIKEEYSEKIRNIEINSSSEFKSEIVE